MDYIFRHRDKYLTNCQVEYLFDTMTITESNKNSYDIPVLNISVKAKDKLNFNYLFEYSIKISLDELNKLSDKPANINESMYHEKSDFLVAKLQQNKFIFKVSIPEYFIFIWFILDFD